MVIEFHLVAQQVGILGRKKFDLPKRNRFLILVFFLIKNEGNFFLRNVDIKAVNFIIIM